MASATTTTATDSPTDKKTPSGINVLGLDLPKQYTKVAYFPVVEKITETPEDAGMDKFGGMYINTHFTQQAWPICHGCNIELSFMFQCLDPVYDPTKSVGEYIQLFLCTNTECRADGCSTCDSEGPCYTTYRYKAEDTTRNTVKASNPFHCFKILRWESLCEPDHYSKVEEYLDCLPLMSTDKVVGLKDTVKTFKKFTDAEWETHVDEYIKAKTVEHSKYSKPTQFTSRTHAVKKCIYDMFYDTIEAMISADLKFGGTPVSAQGQGEEYDDYLQLVEEAYFPYMWGDSGILHVSRPGHMNGDMC